MSEQCVAMHTGCLCMQSNVKGLVYINCVCARVYQSDSLPTQQQRGVTEGLPLRWQTVWSSKICLFSLTGCQSASVFFTPLHSPYLHPSLLFFIPFQWNEKGWALVSMKKQSHYCQQELSIVAVYRTRAPPVGLSPWCEDEMWKLGQICWGGK